MARVLICGNGTMKSTWVKALDEDDLVIYGSGGAWFRQDLEDMLDVFSRDSMYFRIRQDSDGAEAKVLRNIRMIEYGRPDYILCFHENPFEDSVTKDLLVRAGHKRIPYVIIKNNSVEYVDDECISFWSKTALDACFEGDEAYKIENLKPKYPEKENLK